MEKEYKFDLDVLIPEIMVRIMALETTQKVIIGHHLTHLKQFHYEDYEVHKAAFFEVVKLSAQTVLEQHPWMKQYWDDVMKDFLSE